MENSSSTPALFFGASSRKIAMPTDTCTILCSLCIILTLAILYHINELRKVELDKDPGSSLVERLTNIRVVLVILIIVQCVALYLKYN